VVVDEEEVVMQPVSPTVETEIDDTRFGHTIAMGAAIGIPLTFLVSLLVSLPGAGWPLAGGIAVVPALVGGPFVGGFVMLMRALSAPGAHASVTPLPVIEPRPASHPQAA
jgi:hypothetical protein